MKIAQYIIYLTIQARLLRISQLSSRLAEMM